MTPRASASLPFLLLLASTAAADSGPQHRVQQAPPVKMGTSGGGANDASGGYCCGGTLGALVRRDGIVHILSNNHVLARSGSAQNGEDTIQPGLIDHSCGASGANVIGDFPGNYVPLNTANVDAALSLARTGMVTTTGEILDVGVPCRDTQLPVVGMAVTKSGRTTGQTFGTIQAVNVTTTIQYRAGCATGKRFNVRFTNQISITPGTFSAGGDSGSLIVSNDGTPNPVGLLFAGSSAVTIANKIQDVVTAFRNGGHTFEFVGATCSGTPGILATPPDAAFDAALHVKELRESELFQEKDVVGVGVGSTTDDGTGEPAIIVYVDRSRSSVAPRIPGQLDGVPVRVIDTDELVAR